jgi:nicotinate-nucleotide adenylyltransferase
MVMLTIADTPGVELSTVEIDRPGPHYALDTVKIIADQNPGADLVYLMGGDSLRDLPAWHRPADFVSACHIIGVMRRPGDAIDLPALEKNIPGLTAKVAFVDTPLLDIAAHEIRDRIAEGRTFRYFLVPGVYEYIVGHRLYSKA